MMKKFRIAMLYFLALTIPLFLASLVYQSFRYDELKDETARLEKNQEEIVAENRRMIAKIALLSSSERIERFARDELGLEKKLPEEILQIRITGGQELDG
jgi:cell division protein FtsL